MSTREREVIASFLLDNNLEDEEITKKYLEDAQIDGEKFRLKMLEKLKLRIRNSMFEEGENFRDKYLEALKSDDPIFRIIEDELQYAFRKLEKAPDVTPSDIVKDKKKLDILKKIYEQTKNQKKI